MNYIKPAYKEMKNYTKNLGIKGYPIETKTTQKSFLQIIKQKEIKAGYKIIDINLCI